MAQAQGRCPKWHLCLAVILCLAGAASAAKPTLHTVFTTECTQYFTWQSMGMLYSHRKAGQPGPLTRLMSCTKEEADALPDKDKNLCPTHIAPSFTMHPRTGDVYSAYNKPVAVIDWLARNEVKEDYVLIIDADMIMRMPLTPEDSGAKPGWAVAAYFGYMKGVNNELALKHVPEVLPRNDTLAGPYGRRGDQVGGFTLMNANDLRRMAPLWLKYTEDVRFDPDAWTLSGDAYSINPGDKPWISEMYGYSYGAAKADVWHVVHRSAMLYPGYQPTELPNVLHYGLLYSVPGSNPEYQFDKHWHYNFDPFMCPPFGELTKFSKGGLFPHPPHPNSFKEEGLDLAARLLAVEPIIILNAAFCEHHLRTCPPSDELTQQCGLVHEMEEALDFRYKELAMPDPCKDLDPRCGEWAGNGECDKNPGFMSQSCQLACKLCTPKGGAAPQLDHQEGGVVDAQAAGTDAAGVSSESEPSVQQQAAPDRKDEPGGAQLADKASASERRGGVAGSAARLRGGGVTVSDDASGIAVGTAGGGAAAEEAADSSSGPIAVVVKKLRKRCTTSLRWTLEQVKECLKLADAGKVYDPSNDDAKQRAGDVAAQRAASADDALDAEAIEGRELAEEAETGAEDDDEASLPRFARSRHDAGVLLGRQAARIARRARPLVAEGRERVVSSSALVLQRLGILGLFLWGSLMMLFLFVMPRVRRAMLRVAPLGGRRPPVRKFVRSD